MSCDRTAHLGLGLTLRLIRTLVLVSDLPNGDVDEDCSLRCSTSSASPPYDVISHTVLQPPAQHQAVPTTYFRISFRIQPAPLPESPLYFPPSAAVEVQLDLRLDSGSIVLEAPEVKANSPVLNRSHCHGLSHDHGGNQPSSQVILRPGPIEWLSKSAKRFISYFCGRTVHALNHLW
jgi:hypothetical protein